MQNAKRKINKGQRIRKVSLRAQRSNLQTLRERLDCFTPLAMTTRKGVTLIELVVALTLGSLIMMAIIAMYSSSTKMLFNSVKGYENQVEASLAVENMARRLENAVWVNVVGSSICAAVEVNDAGASVGFFGGRKDSTDSYHLYFYNVGTKELRHSRCTADCVNDLLGGVCGDNYSVLASRLDTFSLVRQGANAQSATEKNVIRVEFQSGASTDTRKSTQVTKINLRGLGSYGYYN